MDVGALDEANIHQLAADLGFDLHRLGRFNHANGVYLDRQRFLGRGCDTHRHGRGRARGLSLLRAAACEQQNRHG